MGSDSHGYPYFVQLWARRVWRQVCTPAPEAQRRITRAVVDTAQTAFDRRRNGYYLERYDEFDGPGVAPGGAGRWRTLSRLGACSTMRN